MVEPGEIVGKKFPEVFMDSGKLSFMSGYQANAVSPLEGAGTYKSARAAALAGASGPSSWGADTVSFSSAALGQAQNAGSSKALDQETSGEAGSSVDCKLAVGGKVKDVAGTLEEIAAEDFGKFLELMKKLKSGDPASMLDALAEICGEPRAEVQAAIAGMDEGELSEFAASLGKLTGQPTSDMMQSLRDIRENLELFEEDDKSEAPNSRLAVKVPLW